MYHFDSLSSLEKDIKNYEKRLQELRKKYVVAQSTAMKQLIEFEAENIKGAIKMCEQKIKVLENSAKQMPLEVEL